MIYRKAWYISSAIAAAGVAIDDLFESKQTTASKSCAVVTRDKSLCGRDTRLKFSAVVALSIGEYCIHRHETYLVDFPFAMKHTEVLHSCRSLGVSVH